MEPLERYDQYFLSYSGVSLPLKLVSPLESDGIENRNTYFGACLDKDGHLILVHKVVYGEIELHHSYQYDADGKLCKAEILDSDGELQELSFA